MPSKDLNISAIQCDLHWESIEQNLQSIECLFKTVPKNSDVVVLPEMFATGFSMNAESLAVTMDGDEMRIIKTWAKKYDKAVVGSLIVKDNGKYYNRLLWVNPDGEIFKYDKKHLFTYAQEQQTYSAGSDKLIVAFKGWKVACFICYDLRFPVWNRNVNNEYDAAIYVANWPKNRIEAWKALLVGRAIENQAYVIGVNRIGEDGNGILYDGCSGIINYIGEQIETSGANKQKTLNATLNAESLNNYRLLFPVTNDADQFKLI